MASAHGTHLRRWLFGLPPVEWALQQLRELVIGALKHGPIPSHVAFVMDGNRRYARQNKLETVEGHHLGFEALARILEVCYKSGVQVVTIYAFSIENFKRSKYEVDGLMDMAKTKLVQMSQHGELFDRYGASVRILGDQSLVRRDVLEQVERAVEMTRHNDRAVLNVCFPYTSREEITHAVRETVRECATGTEGVVGEKRKGFSESHVLHNIRSRQLGSVKEQEEEEVKHEDSFAETREDGTTMMSDSESTQEDDGTTTSSTLPGRGPSSHTSPSPTRNHLPDPELLTTADLQRHIYTADAPPLDLLVRTSGVYRLSDFMLWQCHEETEIRFLETLWPEFDLWQFLPVLVEWQWRQRRRLEGRLKGE